MPASINVVMLIMLVLGNLEGFHGAPIPSRENAAGKPGSEVAKPLDSSEFDDTVTVILVNSCQGAEQKITFGHVRNKCISVTKEKSPVLQIKAEPEDLSLTFYDQDGCSGKSFTYNSSQTTPPFSPSSLQITKRK